MVTSNVSTFGLFLLYRCQRGIHKLSEDFIWFYWLNASVHLPKKEKITYRGCRKVLKQIISPVSGHQLQVEFAYLLQPLNELELFSYNNNYPQKCCTSTVHFNSFSIS